MVSVIAAALAMCAASGVAEAQPSSSAERLAEAAFDEGVRAHEARDYAAAARHFARADEILPDTAALEAALSAAILADDPILSIALVERAKRDPYPPSSLVALVERAKSELGPRVGHVRVSCPTACTATLDGVPIEVGVRVPALVGNRFVVFRSARPDGSPAPNSEMTVAVVAGELVEVRSSAESTPPPSAPVAPKLPEEISSGLSPAWFFVGVGTTTVLGAVTIGSVVDLVSKADEFEADPTRERAAAGEAAEVRTYVLEAMTGVALVTTLAIGAFGTDWGGGGGGATTSFAIDVGPLGASVRGAW
jgi:hypothetical protein